MHDILISLSAFIVTTALFTMTPGLDTATVLRASATSGTRCGGAAAVGITAGLFVWGVCAAFGLTALLAASSVAFGVVKWAGALYLFQAGLRMVLRPRSGLADGAGGVPVRLTPRGAFRQGFVSNVLNPKVGIFYITFLPQFIPHGVNVAAYSLFLACFHVVMGLIWFSLLVVMTIPLGRFLSRLEVVRRMDRVTGCIFMGFGLRLAFERRV
ncbi:LysE family translocator [Acetobacter sp. AN02]|uniref:LysE family translocator n=1 Tax=Acetobacter sp. AN02 TaxID=2894186 RepID=UPI00243422EB|nr:LysE family translocator [Acetobacter sp. AN02]MDG6094363.1 LysE family translocator [Acetobacter sp. AN02]